MADVLEVDAVTGEVQERNFTPAELVQRKTDQQAAQAAERAAAAESQARAAVQFAAVEHAKSLGFTDEMIAVMYPALAE